MYFIKFEIENYKSFRGRTGIDLEQGFNLIVGKNNVGKTALVESFTLQQMSKPFRGLANLPTRETPVINTKSRFITQVVLSRQEVIDELAGRGVLHLAVDTSVDSRQQFLEFDDLINDESLFEFEFSDQQCISARLVSYRQSSTTAVPVYD